MNDENRIVNFSPVVSVPRQTPKNDFGDLLSRGAGKVAGAAHGLLVSATGSPVVSTSVASITSLVSGQGPVAGHAASTQLNTTPRPNYVAAGMGGTHSGPVSQGSGELDQVNTLIRQSGDPQGMSDTQSMNQTYLELQRAMELESRRFTTLSNVMKVRHDSAKAAINNIR